MLSLVVTVDHDLDTVEDVDTTTTDHPAVQTPALALAGRRVKEWKDPLGLETVEGLSAEWVRAMGPWLKAVREGAPKV